MATTIGALAYKIGLDSKDFTKGMKLSRQELGLIKKSMDATQTPAEKMHSALEVLNRDNVKAALGIKRHAAAVAKVRAEYSKTIQPVQKTSSSFSSLASSIVGGFGVGAAAYVAWNKFTGMVRTGAQLAITGVKALASNISELDDRLNIQKKVGVTSKQFEAMAIAGKKSGLTIQSIGTSIQRMTRRLAEAAQGKGEALGALQELGVDPKQLNAQGPFEALRSIARAMSKVEGQSDKLRIAFKLFDSEGAQFVNVIGEGTGALDDAARKAERFGNVLTATQQNGISKTAAKFVDLQSIMSGVFTQLTAIGAPAFLKVAEKAEMLGVKMLNIINKYGPEIKVAFGLIAEGFEWIAYLVDTLLNDTERLIKNLARIGILKDNVLDSSGQNAAAGFGAHGGSKGVESKAEAEQVKQQKETNRLIREQNRNTPRAPAPLNTLSVKFLGHLH